MIFVFRPGEQSSRTGYGYIRIREHASFHIERDHRVTSRRHITMRLLLAAVVLLAAAAIGFGATKTFNVTSGNWNTSGNWSPTGVPGNTDDVVIPNGRTCTFDPVSDTCQSVNVNSGGFLTISSANALTVTGAITNSGTVTFSAGGTINVGGSFSGGTFNQGTGCTVNYTGTGTVGTYRFYHLTFTGNFTRTLSGTTTTITGNFSSAGTVAGTATLIDSVNAHTGTATFQSGITVNLVRTQSTISAGSSLTFQGIVQIAGTVNTRINNNGSVTLKTLRSWRNGSSWVNGAGSRLNVSDTLLLDASGAPFGKLNLQAGDTLCYNGSGATANQILRANGQSSTTNPLWRTIILTGGGTKRLTTGYTSAPDINVNEYFLVDTLTTLYQGTVGLTVKGDMSIKGVDSASTTVLGGYIKFNAAKKLYGSGRISTRRDSVTFVGARIIDTTANLTINAPITINASRNVTNYGKVTIGYMRETDNTSGWYNMSTATLTVGSSIFPNNAGNLHAEAVGNTVVYSAAGAQNIRTPYSSYSTLVLSGSGTKSLVASITVDALDSIKSGVTQALGGFSLTAGGRITNYGTITSSGGSTLNMTGTNGAIKGTGTYSLVHLTVKAAGVTIADSTTITMSGNLTDSLSGTLTHTPGGTQGRGAIIMTGSGRSIVGTGFALNKLVAYAGSSISSSADYSVADSFITNGSSYLSTGGTVTLNGASQRVTGTVSPRFWNLTVSGTVTSTAGFTMWGNLTVNSGGSFSQTAGTANFDSMTVLTGSISLFDISIQSVDTLRLGANSNLGVGNSLTLGATGILDVATTTPNTVTYNSSGAQSIKNTTYHHLSTSGGNTKTLSGAVVVNGDLTIGNGTTLAASTFTDTIKGGLTNNGTFTASTSNIVFAGSATGTIGGTGAITFSTLTMNKTDSAATVSLSSSISTATLTATKGILSTGVNALRITTNRSGNGIVLGTVIHKHGFTAGTGYQFEGPNNTVTFNSISGGTVDSVKMIITLGTIPDFTGAVTRLYQDTVYKSVVTVTYTATVRLHYEDPELNGNDETLLKMYQDSVGWKNRLIGTSSTSANWVQQTGQTNINNRWAIFATANYVVWTGGSSTTWSTAGNWTKIDVSAHTPPDSTDVAIIGENFTNAPTVTSSTKVRGITFHGAKSATVTINSGVTLTVKGTVLDTTGANQVHTISVGSGSLAVNGAFVQSDGTNGHAVNLSIGRGDVTVGGNLTQSGGASISFSDTGKLYLAGAHNFTSGTFTAGTGSVIYNGGGAQTVAPGIAYNSLIIKKPTGTTATLSGTGTTVSGKLIVDSAGTFTLDNTLIVSGVDSIRTGTSQTLTSNGYLRLGGNFKNSGTFTAAAGGRVSLYGSAAQLVDTAVFADLSVRKNGGSVTLVRGIRINGAFTDSAGTVDLAGYSMTGTGGTLSTLDSGYVKTAAGFAAGFGTYSLSSGSTVEYNGASAQSVSTGLSYGNLTFTNSGVKTIGSNTTASGDVTINPGATLTISSGALSIAGDWRSAGTLTTATGTVNFTGAGDSIHTATRFGGLTFSGTTYAAAGANLAVLGTLQTTGAFYAGGTTDSIYGDFTNNGTFNFTSGTLVFAGQNAQTVRLGSGLSMSSGSAYFSGGTGQTFTASGRPTFNNLIIDNTSVAGLLLFSDISVNGLFTIQSGSKFDGGVNTDSINGGIRNRGTFTNGGFVIIYASSPRTDSIGVNFNPNGSLEFAGPSADTVGGTGTFATVIISNSSAGGVQLPSPTLLHGDLNITSIGRFNAANNTIQIRGDINNDGLLFGSGGSIVTFDSTGGQAISGSGTTIFDTLRCSDDVTVNQDIEIHGNLYVSSGKTIDGTSVYITFSGSGASTFWGTGTFLFDYLEVAKTGSGALTLSQSLTANIMLLATSGTLDIGSQTVTGTTATCAATGGTIKIGGTQTMPVFADYSFDPASTVWYYGGAQTISDLGGADLYGILHISGGNKTVGSGTTINVGGFLLSDGPWDNQGTVVIGQ